MVNFNCACVLFCVAMVLDSSVRCGVVPSLYKLDIIHYNDFHDRFEETSVSYPVCTSNDTSCLGGFPRLYQEISTLLKEKPKALLLNAGDVFQGTYWYTLLKWNVTQKFINMLPNDAHALGNHEFDDGIAGLVPYLEALQGPVVAANIDTSQEPSLNGLYKPHVVVERNGRKIGIIGLITPDTKLSSHSGNIIFFDPVETAKKEAHILTKEGVDIIIVLSHCGLEVDKKIALEVGEHIDIIVGGHSHSLLWNGEAPNKEYVSGPYPVIVESANDKHKVMVVTAASFSKYLGNLTVYFDESGKLQSFDGGPIFLNRSIPEDPKIKALLKPYTDKLHELVNEVVGYTDGDLLMKNCGAQECAIGDLIADSILNAAKEMNVSNLPHVAYLQRCMIRGSIKKGDITRGSVINTFPFTNNVVTLALQGKYIVEALEFALTNTWVKKPFNGPWLPQISGLRVVLNVTDTKVVSVLVKEDDEFKPLDLEKEYQFVTLDFLTGGGNNFTMVQHGGKITTIGLDRDVLEKYIKRVSPIIPFLDKRLTLVE